MGNQDNDGDDDHGGDDDNTAPPPTSSKSPPKQPPPPAASSKEPAAATAPAKEPAASSTKEPAAATTAPADENRRPYSYPLTKDAPPVIAPTLPLPPPPTTAVLTPTATATPAAVAAAAAAAMAEKIPPTQAALDAAAAAAAAAAVQARAPAPAQNYHYYYHHPQGGQQQPAPQGGQTGIQQQVPLPLPPTTMATTTRTTLAAAPAGAFAIQGQPIVIPPHQMGGMPLQVQQNPQQQQLYQRPYPQALAVQAPRQQQQNLVPLLPNGTETPHASRFGDTRVPESHRPYKGTTTICGIVLVPDQCIPRGYTGPRRRCEARSCACFHLPVSDKIKCLHPTCNKWIHWGCYVRYILGDRSSQNALRHFVTDEDLANEDYFNVYAEYERKNMEKKKKKDKSKQSTEEKDEGKSGSTTSATATDEQSSSRPPPPHRIPKKEEFVACSRLHYDSILKRCDAKRQMYKLGKLKLRRNYDNNRNWSDDGPPVKAEDMEEYHKYGFRKTSSLGIIIQWLSTGNNYRKYRRASKLAECLLYGEDVLAADDNEEKGEGTEDNKKNSTTQNNNNGNNSTKKKKNGRKDTTRAATTAAATTATTKRKLTKQEQKIRRRYQRLRHIQMRKINIGHKIANIINTPVDDDDHGESGIVVKRLMRRGKAVVNRIDILEDSFYDAMDFYSKQSKMEKEGGDGMDRSGKGTTKKGKGKSGMPKEFRKQYKVDSSTWAVMKAICPRFDSLYPIMGTTYRYQPSKKDTTTQNDKNTNKNKSNSGSGNNNTIMANEDDDVGDEDKVLDYVDDDNDDDGDDVDDYDSLSEESLSDVSAIGEISRDGINVVPPAVEENFVIVDGDIVFLERENENNNDNGNDMDNGANNGTDTDGKKRKNDNDDKEKIFMQNKKSATMASLWKFQQILEREQKLLEDDKTQWEKEQQRLIDELEREEQGRIERECLFRRRQEERYDQEIKSSQERTRKEFEYELRIKKDELERQTEQRRRQMEAEHKRNILLGSDTTKINQLVDLMKKYKELVDVGYDDDTIVAMIPDMQPLVNVLVSQNINHNKNNKPKPEPQQPQPQQPTTVAGAALTQQHPRPHGVQPPPNYYHAYPPPPYQQPRNYPY